MNSSLIVHIIETLTSYLKNKVDLKYIQQQCYSLELLLIKKEDILIFVDKKGCSLLYNIYSYLLPDEHNKNTTHIIQEIYNNIFTVLIHCHFFDFELITSYLREPHFNNLFLKRAMQLYLQQIAKGENLINDFKAYHNQKAILRIVKRELNSSRTQ